MRSHVLHVKFQRIDDKSDLNMIMQWVNRSTWWLF